MAGDVLQALMSTGVVPMSAQPDYVHQPPAGYQQLAANYQALAVYGPPVGVPASAGRPPKGGAPADSTGYVAAAIARGYPVTVGISVGNGFNPDADGYITYAQGAGSPGEPRDRDLRRLGAAQRPELRPHEKQLGRQPRAPSATAPVSSRTSFWATIRICG